MASLLLPTGPTGPRTPEGKAVSSQNARKHGFSSHTVFVPPGLEDDYQDFFEGYLRDIQPQGELENSLFHQLVRFAWNCRRIAQRQIELGEAGFDPFAEPLSDAQQKEYDRLENYLHRNSSAMRSTLRELRQLQTNRVVQATLPAPLGDGGLSCLVKPSEILALAKRTHPGIARDAVEALTDFAGDQIRHLPRFHSGPTLVPAEDPQ